MRAFGTSLVAAALALGNVSLSASANEVGAKAYKRCAACHLADGKGVPGAFPALTNRLTPLMATDAGRTYLVMTIYGGLMGPIEVDGVTFRGVMPAQGRILKPEGVAEVLNYIATDLSETPADFKPFTPEEVDSINKANPRMNGRKVHALRQPAYESVEQ